MRVKYISQKQGVKLLDKQARKYLNMSGEEFLRKLDAGEFLDDRCCNINVIRVAMLAPFARTTHST